MGSMLDNSIKFVQGVGEVRAKLLEREIGIVSTSPMHIHTTIQEGKTKLETKKKKRGNCIASFESIQAYCSQLNSIYR